jgi:hypothetical protein
MTIQTADLYPVFLRFIFLGTLLSIFFYVFLRYVFQKDKTALYYTMYTVLLFVYFIFQFTSYAGFNFLHFSWEPLNTLVHEDLLNLIFIFYFFFASSFLDGPKRYPKLDNLIMGVTRTNLGIWCLGAILMFVEPDSAILSGLSYTEFVLIIAMAILGSIAVTRFWSYLEKFFIAGVSALILSGLYTLCAHFLVPAAKIPSLPVSPATMLIFCVLIEQITYAVAIGFKSRREQNKVTLLEKYWINELETNKQLQNRLHESMLKYQEQLELEVQVRTNEMLKRSNELQEEKVQKKLEEYKRAALESELKALRTQINPHFLFNCMNILSSFVFRNMKEEALDFIQKFSRLMRLVLENSTHHAVKVEKDIEALRLYVELEAIRYDHCFKYEFEIDRDLLQDDFLIPPLLLQPYVENAIRHGLVNKEEGDKRMKVSLRLNADHIICEIFDNGVGREKAHAIKKKQKTQSHQSMGMQVTESRINLLKELSGKASVQVIDFSGEEAGTMIRITLPVD